VLVGAHRGCDPAYGGMSRLCMFRLSVLCVFVFLISLGRNKIGDEGAAAIGAGLHGVPSLASLRYVMQAWMVCMRGRRCDVGGRWGEDVAGMVYGVRMCQWCGVVWACEVW
jgi:hypothetical protein